MPLCNCVALFLLFLQTFEQIMNLSREARIGLMVVITLLIFFFGYYFLKGADIFSTDKEYYCFYKTVDGLQNSGPVQIRGLNTGHVSAMKLVDGQGVKVTIVLNKGVEVPEGSVAFLVSDLLGTRSIRLDLGPGPAMLANKATIPTMMEGGIIDNMSQELTPRLKELKSTIISLDTVLANVNVIVGDQNQKAVAAMIQSLKVTSDNFAKLSGVLTNETETLAGILNNTNSITGNLAKENDTIHHILANLNSVTRQLAGSPIQKAFTDLQKTTAQLQEVMDKINSNKGTLGMLINDKEAYNNLSSSLKSLHDLTEDLKAHPSRYINVTVFGKKQPQEAAK
jgi:phospholipid/cholesterol/gamma-HCH transport system substrate-binding protein